MGQCIIKDCGFEYQKSSSCQDQKLKSFLSKRIKERNHFMTHESKDSHTKNNHFFEGNAAGHDLEKKNNFFVSNLGDIKEEEELWEEDQCPTHVKEIKSLRMVPEELEKNILRISNFENNENNLESNEKKGYKNETKRIHNNLRYFLSKENEDDVSLPIKTKESENNILLGSLALTNVSKPLATSCVLKEECFINVNFKKDQNLNDSYEDSKEKYAQIFFESDYSD